MSTLLEWLLINTITIYKIRPIEKLCAYDLKLISNLFLVNCISMKIYYSSTNKKNIYVCLIEKKNNSIL